MDVRVIWGEPTHDLATAPPTAQMRHWLANPVAPDPIGLPVAPGARIFPGYIRTRNKTEHTGGQLMLNADFQLLPASYSTMDGRRTLPSDADVRAPATELAGDHFFLGSLQPHFGHLMLEGVTRTWALEAFLREHPDGRVIAYEPWTPDFGLTLLELAGVEPERLLRPTGPLIVERLHIPDIAHLSHRWTSPQQAAIWRRIGDAVEPAGTGSRRVYLSRRGIEARALVEEAEIEAIFADAGFEIVQPETMDIIDQIRMARQATVLAGCVGSQMYLAAFQPSRAQTWVLAPSNFFLADDALIATQMDRALTVAFGGLSEYRMPQGPWSIDPAAARALVASQDA